MPGMQSYLDPHGHMGSQVVNEDMYANDIARHLSITGASSSEDVICQLRGMNLGDDFWMYSFKVATCAKPYSHKWTLCPCAHAGETARRRDPRLHPYRAVLCPLLKAKKACPMGDNCLWSHNVFEHWLHPSRYKTRLCSFGRSCNRPICFFAHSSEELRTQPADDVDRGKEADEQEYLMQLMLAQEAGILPPGSLPQNAFMQQVGGMRGGPGTLDNLLMMGLGSGPPMGVQNNGSRHHGNQGNHNSSNSGVGAINGRHHGPPAHSASGLQQHQSPQQMQQQQQQSSRQQHQQNQQNLANQRHSLQQQQAATLLMSLQESLANLGGDLNWTQGGPGGRLSDPGSEPATRHQMLERMASAGQAILGSGRASDSGQALNRIPQRDMEKRAPLHNNALAVAVAATPCPLSSGSPHSHSVSPPGEWAATKGCGMPLDSPNDPSSAPRFLSRNSSQNRSSDSSRASGLLAAKANGSCSLFSAFSGSQAEWDPSAEATLRYLSCHPSMPMDCTSNHSSRGTAGSPDPVDLADSTAVMLAALSSGQQRQGGETSAAEAAALRMLSRSVSAAERPSDTSRSSAYPRPSYNGSFRGLRSNHSSFVDEVFVPERTRRESAPQGNNLHFGGPPPPPPPPPPMLGQRDNGLMPYMPAQQHQRRESLGAPPFAASPQPHFGRGTSDPQLGRGVPQQMLQRPLSRGAATEAGSFLLGNSGAAPGSSGFRGPEGNIGADAYVSQLVAQLQEQGVVQSKEELVNSLSQLLAQLLVNP